MRVDTNLASDLGPSARAPRREFLLFSPPSIGDEEIAEVTDTLRSGWITTGPKTARFEGEFCTAFDAPAGVALSSCTAALHAALVAHGVGPGDEVVTSPLTFCSTVHVVEHVGATPVLADVDEATLNMSPDAVERVLSPRTKAIIAVHYGGHPVELDRIQALADARGAVVIEDAAHAVAAKYRGRWIGASTNPVAFSFYATKNLTTGEGGMLTGDPAFVARARVLSLHGMNRDAWKRYDAGGSWAYDVVEAGFKYNMTDIQAALGLAQLRKLERFQRRRREIVEAYNLAFLGVDALEVPREREEVEHAWHLYVLRLRPETLRIGRDRVIEELKARNIGTSVHFIPIHQHTYYRDKYGFSPANCPVAEANFRRMLSLPLHPGLSDGDVCDVIDAVRDVVTRFGR